MRRSSGFTLIELLLVIVILGILGTLAGGMLQIGFDTWSGAMNRSSDSVDAMAMMRYFYRVIPKTLPATITRATNSRFEFSESDGQKIKIRYKSNAEQISIKIGNSEKHIVTNVSKFKCSYAQIDQTPWNSALSKNLIRRIQIDFTAAQQNYSINYFIRNE